MKPYNGPDEYPIKTIPNIPEWSENYACEMGCPKTGAAVFYSSGRLPLDPTVWRELLMMQIPGGRNFFFKGFGRFQNPRGAGGAMVEYEVLEPGRLVHLRFDGPMYECETSDLVANGTRYGTASKCRLDLKLEGVSPVWDMKGKTVEAATMAGSAHLEQACRANGTIELGGEAFSIKDAYTVRDHSRGVRDLRRYTGHNWLNGHFPSGRSFFVYAMKGPDGKTVAMSEAAVAQGDDIRKARVIRTEFITGNEWGKGHTLVLDSEFGEMKIEYVKPIASFPVGMVTPFDTCAGAPLNYDTGMTFDEPMVLGWNGEAGVGWSERGWGPDRKD